MRLIDAVSRTRSRLDLPACSDSLAWSKNGKAIAISFANSPELGLAFKEGDECTAWEIHIAIPSGMHTRIDRMHTRIDHMVWCPNAERLAVMSREVVRSMSASQADWYVWRLKAAQQIHPQGKTSKQWTGAQTASRLLCCWWTHQHKIRA